jgi:hypothetical protein
MSKPKQPDQPPQPRHIAPAGRLAQPETWGPPRSKVVTWYDQAATMAGGAGLSGLGFMQALIDGKIPPPPIALLLNMRPTKVDHGFAVFECTPDEYRGAPPGLPLVACGSRRGRCQVHPGSPLVVGGQAGGPGPSVRRVTMQCGACDGSGAPVSALAAWQRGMGRGWAQLDVLGHDPEPASF